MKFDTIFFSAALFFMAGTLIMMIILILTVGRKFDKLFKDRRPCYDPYIPIFSMGLRAQLYAGCCLFKFYSNGPEPKRLYKGYDFRKNSTLTDKIISALYGFFALTTGLLAVVFYIKQYAIPFLLKYI